MEIKDIKNKLKKALDSDRYEHTLGVMYTSASLAMAYGLSMEKPLLAGLLHDCGKCISGKEKIKICHERKIPVSDVELKNTGLLHAKVGAVFAKEIYEVEDADILHAIQVHTTGQPDMSMLDKIVFVADYIEPHRKNAPRLDYIRKLAFSDIDKAVAEILFDTIAYLNSGNGAIDSQTQVTYDYYAVYREELNHEHN